MIKNSWGYAFIVGLITTLVIISVSIPTIASHKALEWPAAIGALFSVFISFSITVLLVKYNSYYEAYYFGLKASIITSSLTAPSVILTVLITESRILNDVPKAIFFVLLVILFAMFFVFFTIISSLIPFITRKYWGKEI
jgi:hypothetical protein